MRRKGHSLPALSSVTGASSSSWPGCRDRLSKVVMERVASLPLLAANQSTVAAMLSVTIHHHLSEVSVHPREMHSTQPQHRQAPAPSPSASHSWTPQLQHCGGDLRHSEQQIQRESGQGKANPGDQEEMRGEEEIATLRTCSREPRTKNQCPHHQQE
ncbi:uncharacterized protein LOC135115010 isoform X8 [Scylla paramamosain]|uniref:uncharacterized protein LOC135115010 isoform X8 n=1 Tax=Scylla paramamosain TaxID=85552 RepID=UPI003082A08F